MRIFHVAIAGVAAIAGAGAIAGGTIRADVIGAGTAAINPVLAGWKLPQNVAAPNGIRIKSGLHEPAADSGNPLGLPRPLENAVRLAQLNPVNTGNPSVAPLKWVGMLKNPAPTQKAPNAYDFCTAQFIKPNVVLTAGHCLKDLTANPTGPWFDLSKQTFTLQFQNGEGSQTFKTLCGATNPLWTLPANYNSMPADQQNIAFLTAAQHDYAMILVDGTSPTGVMPYQLDWKGKWVAATRIGYAVDILNGQIIQESHGIVFFSDAIPMFPQSFPNIVVHWQSLTDLTNGTSGGGWITNFGPTEAATDNVLIAVTSFNSASLPGAEMAAYLTAAEFNPLLTFVSNGCK